MLSSGDEDARPSAYSAFCVRAADGRGRRVDAAGGPRRARRRHASSALGVTSGFDRRAIRELESRGPLDVPMFE